MIGESKETVEAEARWAPVARAGRARARTACRQASGFVLESFSCLELNCTGECGSPPRLSRALLSPCNATP